MKVTGMSKILPLPILLGISLVLGGGFFDDSVAFIGVALAITLFVMLLKGEAFYARDRRIVFLIPFAILCIAIIVCFWAVDYMDNFMGVMRLGIICLWLWLVRSRSGEEVAATKRLLPVFGCISVILSLLAYGISIAKPLFWENSRMSGFFQYANTNALFLAVGILLLIYHWQEQKKQIYGILQLALLFVGLLLTGSRSVLLLLALWGVCYAIRTKTFRKPFLILSVLFVLLGGSYVGLTGNTANVGRIFTIFTSNSTLWGRLLYYRDAVLALGSEFLGLGRLGYSYTQGTFQSGVYRIKYVHNDFLQLALDYGMIALVLLLLFIGWQIFRGRQNRADKEILLFICLSALVDFHFQYSFMVMMTCLFLDYGECIREKKAQLKENYVILPILVIVFLYIGIATGSNRMGRPDITLSMLPDYSAAQEKVILATMGTEDSYELASRLLQKNPYHLSGYIAKGSFCASQLAVEDTIEALDRMLELDPYNVEYYKQYELLLQNMKAEMQKNADLSDGEADEDAIKNLQLLQERIDTLPLQLEQMKDRTSGLAYKIKDEPIFYYE